MIDSHVHFWNPQNLRYPWLDGDSTLNRPFLPADFHAAADGLDVEGIVFVQADCLAEQGLDEVAWVTSLAAEVPIRGIVAFAPMEQGEQARDAVEALSDYPLVKGVRRLIQDEGPGFARQPAFIEGVQMLAGYGLSFDLCIRHHQLPDVIELVSRCPEVSFVLDHIGKPDIAGGALEPWKQHITTLAAHENVCCKLSGMVTEADTAHWTVDDLRRYADHVLEVFGTERVMFGGDWPVATLASTYRRWADTAQDLLADFSDDDRQRMLVENARRFYRLPH